MFDAAPTICAEKENQQNYWHSKGANASGDGRHQYRDRVSDETFFLAWIKNAPDEWSSLIGKEREDICTAPF